MKIKNKEKIKLKIRFLKKVFNIQRKQFCFCFPCISNNEDNYEIKFDSMILQPYLQIVYDKLYIKIVESKYLLAFKIKK